ncbi:unnamed protein product [Anisakis simplex]|uniref:VWFA domain-containing protein n=1 Tax=Anisakis simplex TaxID=6269 RepID=A0A0M3KBU9_ANISI|nr:unnamed protein product [Anisakis simplex]
MWLFSFWIYPIALLLVCSELVQSCADFIFVIDGSASAPQQFKRVIRLLKGVADELRIDSTGHRVAILEYSSLAKASKWRRYYFEHISVRLLKTFGLFIAFR